MGDQSDSMLMIGELRGRMTGVEARVESVERVATEGRDAALRTEAMMARMVGSGPYPIVKAPQEATEPQTGSAGRFLKRHGVHVVWGGVAVILGIALIAAIWNRNASDLAVYPTATIPSKEGAGP